MVRYHPIGGLALVALFVGLGVDAVPLAAQQRTVTLAEAIRLAEQIQPTVVQARGNVATANAQRRSALGAYLPDVRASSTASDFFSEGAARVDPITGQITTGNSSNRSVSANLSASIDLFTGFRRGPEMRAARAGQTAAEASLTQAQFQQALTTTNAFFDALAASQLVSVREASVRRAQEQLKVAVAKLHAGSATRSDSLRSLVTLGTAQLDLLTAQTNLAAAEAMLGSLVGSNDRVRAANDSAFDQPVSPIDTAAVRAEAEAHSPRVQSAVASATAASASARAARAAYWPSLALAANTGWNGSRANDYNLLNQRQLSLQLSWSLFNGFSRELTITQQDIRQQVAEAEATDARRAVTAALTQQLAELDAARARIDITHTSVAAAQEDLRVQQERYRVGVSTIVDVLTSQEALSQAEVNVVVARFDYLRAKAQLEALIGRKL